MSPSKHARRAETRAAQHPESRDDKRRLLLPAVAVALFFVAGLLVLSAVPSYSLLSRGSGPPRAAIVDQLSLTVPNPDFVESATETLERAGYIVDY